MKFNEKELPIEFLLRKPRSGQFENRKIIIDGKTSRIPLTKGLFATIDTIDIPLVDGYNWTPLELSNTTYVRRQINRENVHLHIYLHRQIMGFPELTVDHKNGNGLINTRINLREATFRQQANNRNVVSNNPSGKTGVILSKGLWVASITHEGLKHQLGSFHDMEEAISARVEAEKKYHGEFARK